MEEFSDGRIISTKYEPVKKYVSNPKVIILANWPPLSDKLSDKRLVVYSIDWKPETIGDDATEEEIGNNFFLKKVSNFELQKELKTTKLNFY